MRASERIAALRNEVRLAAEVARLEQENRELRAAREADRLNRQALEQDVERQRSRANEFRLRAEAAESRLAQVSEALREMDEALANWLWTSDDGVTRRDGTPDDMEEEDYPKPLVDAWRKVQALRTPTPPTRQESARLTRMVENIRGECERSERLTADDYNARVTPEAAAHRPATAHPPDCQCYEHDPVSHKLTGELNAERPATARAYGCQHCGRGREQHLTKMRYCPQGTGTIYTELPAGEELPTLCAHGRLDECCPDCVRGTDAR